MYADFRWIAAGRRYNANVVIYNCCDVHIGNDSLIFQCINLCYRYFHAVLSLMFVDASSKL